jgi:hypothetical protein
VWVRVLDVEEGERDRINARDLLRAAFLEDPLQADFAFSELVLKSSSCKSLFISEV